MTKPYTISDFVRSDILKPQHQIIPIGIFYKLKVKKRKERVVYMCFCGCRPYQVMTLAKIGTMTPNAMLGTKLIKIA
jgi:hypothetical protein